jgi:hypothetical protein
MVMTAELADTPALHAPLSAVREAPLVEPAPGTVVPPSAPAA